MPNFEKMYYQLFNAITDSIEETEKMNFGQAKSILIQAQQKCEEMYISETPCALDSRMEKAHPCEIR